MEQSNGTLAAENNTTSSFIDHNSVVGVILNSTSSTSAPFLTNSSITPTVNTTLVSDDQHPELNHAEHGDTLNFVIPLIVIAFLVIVAAVIFFVIRRRSMKQRRQQFAPVYYSVEHEESGNEWESRLMEDELSKHTTIVKPNRANQARLMFEKGGGSRISS